MKDLTPVLEAIQERVLLSDVIRSDVDLKRKGKTFLGCCPFHKEKSPSFSVDDEKNRYHCFGCGVSGNIFNYYQEKRGFTFIEAVEHLANQIGIQLPKNEKIIKTAETDRSYEILEKAALWMQKQLQLSTGEKARDYLEKRKISKESIVSFRLGYTPLLKDGLFKEFSREYTLQELIKVGLVILGEKDQKPIDRFRGRLMFPICDRKGRVIAFGGRALEDVQPKYLNSSETHLFSKSKILYAHHLSQKNVTSSIGYIVVEGYLDVIMLHQSGFNTAVAPLGTALTEEHAKLLWRHQITPMLCFDGDKAGYGAAIRAAHRMLPLITNTHTLKFTFLPEGEDPDSLIRKDKDFFIKTLQKPFSLSEVLWRQLEETHPFKTPEDQSLFKKAIKEIINQIANTDLKDAYRNFFEEKFIELKALHRKKPVFQKREPQKNLLEIKLKKPIGQNKDVLLLQKIILATLIVHPYLIQQISDQLTLINFDKTLIDAVDFILTCDELKDKVSVLSKAEEMRLSDLMYTIIDEKVLNKAPFVKKTDGEHILLGWQEIYNRLEYLVNLEREVLIATESLKRDFNEDEWKRIKELHSLKSKGLVE